LMRRAARPTPCASPIDMTGDEIDSGRDVEGCQLQPSQRRAGRAANEGKRSGSILFNMSQISADRAAGGVTLAARCQTTPPYIPD